MDVETGLDVEITGLVGMYTDPRRVIAYTDGEVRRQFNVCFTARVVGGARGRRAADDPRPALSPRGRRSERGQLVISDARKRAVMRRWVPLGVR
ncbi:hypothetical protein GCM10017744_054210 [Streptomyces antimycoticus]|uniref:Uncharacterized protein n=1 Tax=Streptomyces antimycoticus TaxID=68175 RepID=A0A4D4KDF8_9ACTN|nr:hypothetical protein SANT12839_048050 [Streptomyces antimycoticus]